ncbi:hypothetical protein LZ554_001413 [Drepanopeziza brunnea f. sp. 'monogermtubi']|nr:hypothetical protein LZ554_001413 [Drepanopeziza brunnea f. sp. 'monogermtubi']
MDSTIISEKMAPSMLNMVISSFILSNLHCPSCVSTIKNTLYALDPSPFSVSPSLVSSVVTVEHSEALPATEIQEALENAGFEIYDAAGAPILALGTSHMGSEEKVGYLDRIIDRFSSDQSSRRRQKRQTSSSQHVQQCDACRTGFSRSSDSNFSSSANLRNTNAMSSASSVSSIVVIDSTDSPIKPDLWRASLAIGGMTCAACVGAITEDLEKNDWVKKVVVNLISNSATIDFIGEHHKDDIVRSIEDIGYEAAIDTVVDTNQTNSVIRSGERTMEIQVDGMVCEHCPPRVHAALKIFGNKVKVDRPVSLESNILKITYIPQVPHFTIRNIIQALAEADNALTPSIYHPPTLEERSRQLHAREQLRILIRVILTLIVAIPTLIIGIIYMSLVPASNGGRMYLMKTLEAGVSRAQWALFIMSTPVYFLCADVFHIRALKEIRSMWRRGSPTPILQRFYRFGSMNMLMSLGTSIAYISSVAQLIAAAVQRPKEVDNSEFYFDSVVFLTLFLLVGRLIESYSKSKTGDAVTLLGKLRPTEALLVESGRRSSEHTLIDEQDANGTPSETTKNVNVDMLEFGDVVKILHGGSPPCDGAVVQGESKFDESSLTGESRLVHKILGDDVFSGTVNKGSPISVQITGVAGASMLDQIVKAVREGQTRRAPMERIADVLTGYFVPFVTLIALMTWLVWLGLGMSGALPKSYLGTGKGGDTSEWVAWSLQFAIAVFVVACPCGLALAAPTALFVGGGLAAKYGILVKGGGEAFEKASKLDCVVFDKTGTLTIGGEPVVTDLDILPFDSGMDHMESRMLILGMVGALESNSSHPIAKALVSLCKTHKTTDLDVDLVEETAGRGLSGKFFLKERGAEAKVIIGNEAFMKYNDVVLLGPTQSTIEKWKLEGKSIALAAISVNHSMSLLTPGSWEVAAMFAISDPIRPEAPGIIKALQARGTDVWMLSGDNQMTADAIGTKIGIPTSNIIAGVLPSEKAEKINYLQRSLKACTSSGAEHSTKRALVAMVGDGINDSPALTTADVGIAIGSGSDIAISSAEFVLVSSNLNSLITLLDLSRFVFRRIKFNFGWALIYNLIALPVAAGVLYPIVSKGHHVRLDPVWGSLAMAMSSISVVCSSLALRSRVPWIGFKAKEAVGEKE